MNSIGIIGHSFGANAAYKLISEDHHRFKTGVALDSIPFEENVIAKINKPFLVLLSLDTIDMISLTKQELATKMGLSLDDINEYQEKNKTQLMNEKQNYQNILESKIILHAVIPGIKHMGFTDLILLKELPIYKKQQETFNLYVGECDGFKTAALINSKLVEFLNNNLKI